MKNYEKMLKKGKQVKVDELVELPLKNAEKQMASFGKRKKTSLKI